MYKIPLAVLAVLVSGGAILFYISVDEGKQPRRAGVVLESTSSPTLTDSRSPTIPESRSVAGLGAPLPAIRSTPSGNRLVLGRISSNVPKYLPRLQAMANYLSIELAGQGISSQFAHRSLISPYCRPSGVARLAWFALGGEADGAASRQRPDRTKKAPRRRGAGRRAR